MKFQSETLLDFVSWKYLNTVLDAFTVMLGIKISGIT